MRRTVTLTLTAVLVLGLMPKPAAAQSCGGSDCLPPVVNTVAKKAEQVVNTVVQWAKKIRDATVIVASTGSGGPPSPQRRAEMQGKTYTGNQSKPKFKPPTSGSPGGGGGGTPTPE